MCVKSCCFSTFLSKVSFQVWMKCTKLQLQLVFFSLKVWFLLFIFLFFPCSPLSCSCLLCCNALALCSYSLLLLILLQHSYLFLFSIWSVHLVALPTLLTYFLHTKLCFLSNNDLLFLLFKKISSPLSWFVVLLALPTKARILCLDSL